MNGYLENRYPNDLPDLLKKQSYTKYPLVNDPVTPLKNINYKDWLSTYDPEGISLVSPQPYSPTWYNVVSALLAITAIVIALSNPITLTAGIAATAGITAALLPIIWPQGEDNALFNSMMWVTTDMLNKELSGLVQAQSNAILLSLRNELEAYQRALSFWRNNQQSQPAINEVVHRYHTTNSIFRTTIPLFTLENYDIQLLPTYALTANLHLLHLRDGVQYADSWSLAKSDSDTDDTDASVFNGDFQYQEFLHFMDIYSEYCTEKYWEALSIMEDAVNKNMGWDWRKYNNFRSLMTTSVLDYVSLFPTYDIRIYNTRLKMEFLTRKLYSNPINFLEQTKETVQQLEKKYTEPPINYRTLDSIVFHTSGTANQYSTYYLSGHICNYINTQRFPSNGPFMGKATNINRTLHLPLGYRIGVSSVDTLSLRRQVSNPTNDTPSSIMEMHFKVYGIDNAPSYKSGNTFSNPIKNTTYFPRQKSLPDNYAHYNHVLNSIILADIDDNSNLAPIDQTKSYSFSWTHESINPLNFLQPINDLQRQATIFSILKLSFASNGTIIKGYSHTGGDVFLSRIAHSANLRTTSLSFPFDINDFQTRPYQIRLRYASNSAVDLTTELAVSNSPSTNEVKNVKKTFNHNSTANLRIRDFSYITLGDFTLHSLADRFNNVFIRIVHPKSNTTTGDSLFIIDKIEFIPR